MSGARRAVLVLAVAVAGGSCGDDGSSADDDRVAWCRAATTIVAHADVIGPDFDGDPAAAAVNLDRAVADAVDVAPEQALADLARFRDLIVLFREALTQFDRLDARESAWDETDRPRLAASIEALDSAMATDCEVSLVSAVGPPLLEP